MFNETIITPTYAIIDNQLHVTFTYPDRYSATLILEKANAIGLAIRLIKLAETMDGEDPRNDAVKYEYVLPVTKFGVHK